jgi:hypothetical protein
MIAMPSTDKKYFCQKELIFNSVVRYLQNEQSLQKYA